MRPLDQGGSPEPSNRSKPDSPRDPASAPTGGAPANADPAPIRLYRLLLRAYPRPFRERFDVELEQAFRDVWRVSGSSRFGLWRRILWDVAFSAFIERRDEMSRSSWALLAAAAAAGAAIAWVDSRPGWDDTAITAGALLLTSACFGAANPRRPLLTAIAVGAWIPIHGILRLGNPTTMLALIFAVAGAYTGAGLRRAFAPPDAPAGDRP